MGWYEWVSLRLEARASMGEGCVCTGQDRGWAVVSDFSRESEPPGGLTQTPNVSDLGGLGGT